MRIKILEKPKINRKECKNVIHLKPNLFSDKVSSLKEIPVMYVIYDGTRGKIHGEKKERSPPKNAIKFEIPLCIENNFPPFNLNLFNYCLTLIKANIPTNVNKMVGVQEDKRGDNIPDFPNEMKI